MELRRTIFCGVLILGLGVSARAQLAGPGAKVAGPTPQGALDALALPLAERAFQPALPVSYAAWTLSQRNTVPALISSRCGLAWLMMNPGGKLRLLPSAMDTETNQLVLSVCMAGKMPRDWPGRDGAMVMAKDVLGRAAKMGGMVRLPVSLQ